MLLLLIRKFLRRLSPQNAIEANIITERINRNKRRKVIREIVQNSVLSQNLLEDLERSSKVLKACETVIKCDALKKTFKDANSSGYPDHSMQTTDTKPLTNFQFSTYQSIHLCTGQKLGNYDDLFLNRVTPYLGSFSKVESEDIVDKSNKDFLLQRYLKHKGITYKKFCLNKLEEEFNFFRRRILQIDVFFTAEAVRTYSNTSIANVTRQLMAEPADENDEGVTSMIQDILMKEGQGFAGRIKKSSERISEVDSAFQDEIFTDSESVCNASVYVSQRSNVDSGIENDLMDSYTSLSHVLDHSLPENTDNLSTNQGEEDENTDNLCTNQSMTDVFEENISSDDIPQDSIVNSTDNSVNIDIVSSVQTSDNASITNCSANDFVEPSEIPEEQSNTDENPELVDLTSSTVFNPLPQKQHLKTQKRKLKTMVDDSDVSPAKHRRTAKFKWLKTTTTTLKKFERFFLQHYIAEDEEVDPNNEPNFEDISEDEQESDDVLVDDATDNVVEEEPEELFEVVVVEEVPNEEAANTPATIAGNGLQCGSANAEVLTDSASLSIVPCDSNQTEASANIPVSNSISEFRANIELAETSASSSHCTNCNLIILNREIPVSTVDIEATNRTRAINEWKSFIEPKLKKIEKSSDFDIHQYGSRIMDAIPEGQNLAFRDIAAGKSSSDVCKLFLASLQLANTYNLKINSSEPGQLANETLSFELLTRERYHEHLGDYEAPSEHSFRERLERVRATCPTNNLIYSTPRASTSGNLNRGSRLE